MTDAARFVRAENVKHYRDLLARTTGAIEHKKIRMLLAVEERKQTEAWDFDLRNAAGGPDILAHLSGRF
jgi:hypothetical protein